MNRLGVAAVVSLLTACGGQAEIGGGTKQGVFLDGNIGNLAYVTGGSEQRLAAGGTYQFEINSSIRFKIGALELTQREAELAMDPSSFAEWVAVDGLDESRYVADISQHTPLNITRILLTLDEDGDASNGIMIPEQAHSLAPAISVAQPVNELAQNPEVTEWIRRLHQQGAIASEQLVSTSQALAYLTQYLLDRGQQDFINGYRLVKEYQFEDDSRETAMIEATNSYDSLGNLETHVIQTYFTGEAKLTLQMSYVWDGDKLASVKQDGWRNWWRLDSGDHYEDFESTYIYQDGRANEINNENHFPEEGIHESTRALLTYDPFGRIDYIEYDGYRDDEVVSTVEDYTYDSDNHYQLAEISSPGDFLATYTYHANGSLASYRGYDEAEETYNYDEVYSYPEAGIVHLERTGTLQAPYAVRVYEPAIVSVGELASIDGSQPQWTRYLPSYAWH